MSFLSSKGERSRANSNGSESDAALDEAVWGDSSTEIVSALGPGMLIKGNIVCAGSVRVLGRVFGDIHAKSLLIGEGARVEGQVLAQEMVIQGTFKGTARANKVKLQGTAVVDGEVFNGSLSIEPSVQFEGTSRRLDRPVEAPSEEDTRLESSGSVRTGQVVPISGSTA